VALADALPCGAWLDACIALLLLALLLLQGMCSCVAPPKSVGCALIFGNTPPAAALRQRARRQLRELRQLRARARRQLHQQWRQTLRMGVESNKNC